MHKPKQAGCKVCKQRRPLHIHIPTLHVSPAVEDFVKKEARRIKWNMILAYACVVFGAGGALLPATPEHWRVFIVALAGQIQSYLPPVQTYSQRLKQNETQSDQA